jgi:osmoprotectant transport system substrate-binding protein
MKPARALVLAALVLAGLAGGCGAEDDGEGSGGGTGGGGAAPGSAIRPDDFKGARFSVGSKEFTEQLVLGQIAVEALKAGGALVKDMTGIEGSEAARRALTDGEIDMYWEYTGTAQLVYLNQDPSTDPEEQFRTVSQADKENGITWLAAAPANNAYAIAVRREARRPLDVQTISDLKDLVERRPADSALCLAEEFAERSDGLPGIEKTYGFSYPDDLRVEVRAEGEIYEEVDKGARCTFGEVFLTDGRIVGNDLIVLEDDKGFATTYNPALNIRTDVLKKHPKLEDLFGDIAERLDNDTLRRLNAEVDVDGSPPDEVAQGFLEANGFTG